MKKITVKMVKDINCPAKILEEVLKRGKDDEITMLVADHPNCPSKALAKFLNNGKKKVDTDITSEQIAAENPNCPKEVLEKLVRNGGYDQRSYYACCNPNCPIEVLVETLEKNIELIKAGKHFDEELCQNILENPNCPPEIVNKWKMYYKE